MASSNGRRWSHAKFRAVWRGDRSRGKQASFALAIGVSPTTAHRYVTGALVPPEHRWREIAAFVGVGLDGVTVGGK